MARIDTTTDTIAPNSTADTSGLFTERDIDNLKTDISKLQEDFKNLFSDVTGMAKKGSERSIEKSKLKAEDAKEQFYMSKETAEEKIREKPLTSVAIALGAGAFLALLMKK